ncbi:hypothetical protein DL98DRAFT_622685 [Cadophora sp. DSE1049]|nr:hypothetical protein DL98DRAFT_622685 [Cadophora sp. DSE1049]
MPPPRVYRSIKDQFYVAAVNRPHTIPEARVTQVYEQVRAEVWQEYPDEDPELQCYLTEYYAWARLFQKHTEFPGRNAFKSLWEDEKINRHLDNLNADKEEKEHIKEICDMEYKNEELRETIAELVRKVTDLGDEVELLTSQLVDKKLEDRLSNEQEIKILALKQELRDAISRKSEYILANRKMNSHIDDTSKIIEKLQSANKDLQRELDEKASQKVTTADEACQTQATEESSADPVDHDEATDSDSKDTSSKKGRKDPTVASLREKLKKTKRMLADRDDNVQSLEAELAKLKRAANHDARMNRSNTAAGSEDNIDESSAAEDLKNPNKRRRLD